MSFIEEYRKRFKEKKSLEGVDEDALWGSISDSLDQIDGADEKKKRRFVFFWLFLGVVGLSLATLLFNTIERSEVIIDSNDVVNTGVIKEMEVITSKDKTKNIENNHTFILDNPIGKQNKPSIINEINSSDKTTQYIAENDKLNSYNNVTNKESINAKKSGGDTESFINYSPNSENDLDNNMTPAPSTVNQLKSDIQKTENTDSKITTTKDKLPKSIVLIDDESNRNEMKLLSSLSIMGLNTKRSKEELSKITMSNNPPTKKSTNWEVGTFGGLSFALNSFGENIANPELSQTLEDSYTTNIGYSTSIHAYWTKKSDEGNKEKFHIKTGLELFEHQSEFNIVHVSETVVARRGFSGQEEYIPATATRTIVHDNKFRYLSIPMEIGLKHSYHKFNVGISTGLGFNYFISQKGKSMNQNDEIREINNANTGDTPYRRAFLSYHISPFVGYDMTEKSSIRFNSNLRYQNHGTSKFYGLNQSSTIIGFNVGLMYKL